MAKKKTAKKRSPARTGNTLATKAASAAAAEQVKKWVIEGHTHADIVQAIAENFATMNAAGLIEAAADALHRDARANLDIMRGWALNAYREVYRRALETGDFSAALRAAKEIYAVANEPTYDEEEQSPEENAC